MDDFSPALAHFVISTPVSIVAGLAAAAVVPDH